GGGHDWKPELITLKMSCVPFSLSVAVFSFSKLLSFFVKSLNKLLGISWSDCDPTKKSFFSLNNHNRREDSIDCQCRSPENPNFHPRQEIYILDISHGNQGNRNQPQEVQENLVVS